MLLLSPMLLREHHPPATPLPVPRPFDISGVQIAVPLTLAPMAGQTNYVFRALCRETGAVGLVCTELLSSSAMLHKSTRQRTFARFDWSAAESPFAVQLSGADPQQMAQAARIVVEHGANIVDINMGCWVPKVAKTGSGAALLRDLCAAERVVDAVVRAVDVPVTVKIRAGFTRDNPTAVPFAQAAARCGVAAVAVHWRFAEDGFTGERPDWSVIGAVKQAVSIPVIGNGDVKSPADARRMLAQTGCDAVMIGRAALGNPWIFRQIAAELMQGVALPAPTPHERAALCLRHAELTLCTTALPAQVALFELRGQLVKYVEALPQSAQARAQIVRAETLADIERALAVWL